MQFKDRFNKLFGIDPDKVQIHGKTRLQDAIDAGNLERVRSLISARADANDAGNLIHPPLHQAIMRGESTISYFLLSAGNADVNRVDFRGDSPLKLASMKGDWFIAKEILAHKAQVDARDADGRTPLFFVDTTRPDIVELLVGAGATINARDKDANTPLHHRAGDPRIVKALLDLGADPALVNTENKSAAQLVLEANPSDGEVVIALTRAGADITHPDKNGRNVVHYLVMGENIEAAAHALRHAPQTALARDADGKTPLTVLLEECLGRAGMLEMPGLIDTGSEAMLTLLLGAGADPNVVVAGGRTWMHQAALHERNLPMIGLLAQSGADLNARDDRGCTPLELAIKAKLIDTVDALLDLGADPNVKDERGWTLLDNLGKTGDRDSIIVQRLISGGGVYNKLLPQNPAHAQHRHAAHGRPHERRKTPLLAPRIKDDPRPPQA